MNLSYSAEYEQFRQEVRTFLREHWTDDDKAAAPPIDQGTAAASMGAIVRTDERATAFRTKAIERGYLYRHIPRRYGGADPGLAGIVPKLHSTTLAYELAKLAMDLMSDRGCLYPGEPNAPAMGMFGTAYMWYYGMAIGGGAPNIQRNVIAERGLGLPRDARK